MKTIAQYNATAARAERKIAAAYSAAEKAYDKLDDIARDLYRRAGRKTDPAALAALGEIAGKLHTLVSRGVIGTTNAHYVADHVLHSHRFLKQGDRLRSRHQTEARR